MTDFIVGMWIGVIMNLIIILPIILFLLANIWFVTYLIKSDRIEQLRKDNIAYNCWVKYTGNEKELTFNEWYVLVQYKIINENKGK